MIFAGRGNNTSFMSLRGAKRRGNLRPPTGDYPKSVSFFKKCRKIWLFCTKTTSDFFNPHEERSLYMKVGFWYNLQYIMYTYLFYAYILYKLTRGVKILKRFKRASSLLLALAMILAMIPTGILSATASAPTVGENVLHASYSLSGVNVDGTLDLANEPVWRRTITLSNGDTVSAAWNAENLYLAFVGNEDPTVTSLTVNGKTEGFTSASGATAVEYKIPLASVGISQIDYSGTYSLAFTVDGVAWSGVLVFEMSSYPATQTAPGLNFGATKSNDNWTVYMNSYGDEGGITGQMNRDYFAYDSSTLASSLSAPTVVEMDVIVNQLPVASVPTGYSRDALKGLNITILDDENKNFTSSRTAEALFTGLYRDGNENLCLLYWENGAYATKIIGSYSDMVAQYHLRMEFSYTQGNEASTDSNNALNDNVTAKYYLNGKLVAQSSNAKQRNITTYGTDRSNLIMVMTQAADSTEANRVDVTIKNFAITKGNSTNWLHAAYADMDGDTQVDANAIRQNVTLSSGVKVGAAWDWKNLYVGFSTADHGITTLTVNGQNVPVGSGAELTVPLADLGINLTSQNVATTYPVSVQIGGYTWSAALALDTNAYSINNLSVVGYGEEVSTDTKSVVLNTYEETGSHKWRDMVWPTDTDLASSLEVPTIIELDVTVNQLGNYKFYPTNYKSGNFDRAFVGGGLTMTVIDDVTLEGTNASEALQTGIYRDGEFLMLAYWDNVAEDYVSVAIDTYTVGKQYHLRIEYSYTAGDGVNTDNNDIVAAKYFVNGKCVAQSSSAKVYAENEFSVAAANRIVLATQDYGMSNDTASANDSVNITVANLSISKTQSSILTDKAAADTVDAKITAISTVTLDSETAIETARTAYDALTDTQKALVTNLSVLEAAETKLADLTAAKAVDDQIDAIGAVTLGSETAIENARDAYEALTPDQKALVTKLDVLTAAEAALAALEDQAAAKTVDDQIAAIGEVTLAKKTAIEAARAAYNALTADQKALVTNLSVLEAAETELAELQDAVDDIEEKIAAIGEVTIAKGLDIRNIKDDFDALTPEQQAAVENVAVLTAALNTLNELCEGVSHVIDLIDAIGTVTYTQVSMDKIVAAENAYAALNQEQKSFVENVEDLEAARDAYNALKAAAEKEAADKAAAKAVQDKIDAIGTVTLEKKADIDVARAAYDGLTADQKALVTNVKTLTDAEAALKALQDAADKETVDKAAAKAVADKIAALGTVTLESKEAIEAARTAYDGLTADQKALVTNVKTLTDAEAALKALQDAAEKEAADKAAAKAVADKIAAIGTVTLEKKAAIEAARAAYDALTANQKAFVENYKTLTDAEAALKALQAAADKEAADKAAAKAVQDKIAAIGTVTLEKKAAIEAAEAAYKALTADQKALVTNYKTLIDARAAYDKLVADKEAADKEAADKAAAKAAQDKIAAIGTVTLEKKADIDVARAAYDALTAEQKALVTNVKTLTDAEAALKALQAAADKETVDKAAAKAVADKIAAIGTVTLEKKATIEAARTAYDGLTADQKALVTNVKTLTDAEAALKALQDAADKEAADKAAAKAVADKIAALGTVTLESKEAIEAARAAYDKLTAEQKALIGDVKALTDAEAALKSLQAAAEQEAADKAAAEAVEKLIADIGDVTLESDEAIKAARAAYDKLTAAQKALVKNYKALADSETALKDLEDAQDAPSKTGDDTPIGIFVTVMVIGLLGVVAMLIPAVRRKLLGK